MNPSISISTVLKDSFDPQTLINDLFLASLETKSLNSINFASIQSSLLQAQSDLQKLRQRCEEELETCLLVSEINAESRKAENSVLITDYDELEKMALELEYALTRSEEGTLHIENSLNFLENAKRNDLLTKELLETFLELNKGDFSVIEGLPFEKQALYLHILEKLAQSIGSNAEYEKAIGLVKSLFQGFKAKLMVQFKEAFWKYDPGALKSLSAILEKYGLMQEMSVFFIETSLQEVKTFKTVIDPKDFDFNCRLFLETLQGIIRAFKRLFEASDDPLLRKSNDYQIQEVFGDRALEIVKFVFSYTFENFLRKGLEFFLEPNKNDIELYLRFSEFLAVNLNYFMSEVGSIETPIKGLVRELLSSYSNSLLEDLRSGYYEFESIRLHDFIDARVTKVLSLFKTAENPKKAIKSPEKSKKKGFSLNALIQETIFLDQPQSNNAKKKVSKHERTRKLAILKDPNLGELIEECFRGLNESARRCLLISQELNKTIHMFGLLEIFLNSFANGLLEPLINYTGDVVPSLNSKKCLDESFFEIASRLTVLVQRIELAYQNCVKSLSLSNETQDFINKKDNCIQKLTIALHKIIQTALASIFIHSNRILTEKQRKKDFQGDCPTLRTEACAEFIKHLKLYVNVIKIFAFDKTRMNILSSLGTQIISMISEHLTHYKVNAKGSGTLLNDLNEYNNFINDFAEEALRNEMNIFLNVAKVLTIPNEKVGDYCKEKGIENKELLALYLKNKN